MIYIGTRVSQLAVKIYDDKALHFCNVDVKPFERGAIYRLIPVMKQFRRTPWHWYLENDTALACDG